MDKISTTESPVFDLKHVEFFCGKLPIKIYCDERSGIHFAFVEFTTTNQISASVNYVTYPSTSGISNATANIALRGTNSGLSADRFEHYLGNIFSSKPIEIDVKSDHTTFSFDSISGTSGYIQLLTLLLESLSTPLFGYRDYNHQIYNSDDLSGKLYEELRNSENQLQNVVNKARRKYTFYESAHGNDFIGTSRDLQSSCTLKRITEYFQRFYRDPWILLSGSFDPKLDLNLLDTLSLKYSYVSKHNQNRVFPNYSNLIATNAIKDVRFHYSDAITVSGIYETNDRGIVQIGFLAASPTNVTFIEAFNILSEYLCGSRTSYLNIELASGKNAICSSVDIQLNVGARCEVVVQFNGVKKRYLNRGVVERFFAVIESIRWDIEELHEIVVRRIRHYNSMIEGTVSNEVFKRLRIFQLYGDIDDSLLLKRLLNPTLVLNELLQLSAVYWKKFSANLFTENCVVVVGVPELRTIQHLEQLGHTRESKQFDQTSNKREKKLRRSTELVREIFKPNDLFISQQTVDVSSALIYPFHKIFPITLKPFHWNLSGSKLNLLPEWFKSLKSLIDAMVPLSITVHNLDSEYLNAIFLFDVKNVELRLRYYILIFKQLLFSSPSTINGNFMFASEVHRMMQKEIIEHECNLGFEEDHLNILQLSLKVPADKLELIEKWFNVILCNSTFDIEDITRAIISLLNSAQNSRTNGLLFCKTLLNSTNFQSDDEGFFLNDIVLEDFHGELLKSLLDGNHQQIMDDLQLLRNQLLNSKISLHLVGNPKKFASTHILTFDDLTRFRIDDNLDKILVNSKSCLWPVKSEIHIISSKEIIPISHMIENIEFKCQSFDDNHAAILIFCRYFSMNGGIFWRYIEEDGQAMSAKFKYKIQKNQLSLTINGAKNLKPTRQLVSYLVRQMFIDSLDDDLFKVAQKSLASEIVSKYSTMESVGLISVYNDLHGWTIDQITSFVHKILTLKASRCQVLLYDLIAKLNQGKNLKAISCPAFQFHSILKSFHDILQLISIFEHKDDEKFRLQ